jgi:hypothetical protein
MDSTTSPKVKIVEGKRAEMHSLTHHTLKVEERVEALG